MKDQSLYFSVECMQSRTRKLAIQFPTLSKGEHSYTTEKWEIVNDNTMQCHTKRVIQCKVV